MANFRPKQPITGKSGEYYADTLENFLKRRPQRTRHFDDWNVENHRKEDEWEKVKSKLITPTG